jgi:ABC-type transport system involved in multi-copper enzyme maturation permease subunit
MVVLTIARITLREASRRKLLLAVAILTVVVAVLSGWGFHKLLALPCGEAPNTYPCPVYEDRLVAATLLILLLFMFSFVLALGAAFLAAPSIANDVESGVALAMLPRPIRRSDLVLGKWLGLATLIAVFAGLACGMEFVISNVALSYVPPHPILAIVFVVAESVTVMTLALALSTRIPAMTGGISVVILFGLTWMGGITGAVGAAFHVKAIRTVGTVSSLLLPTDGLWRAAIYNLEPVALIIAGGASRREASGNPFFVKTGPATPYLIWAALWLIAVLAIGIWSFNRREL